MSASCLAAFGLEKNYFLQKMHQFSRLQTKESESLVVINETPSPQSAPPTHPQGRPGSTRHSRCRGRDKGGGEGRQTPA